MPRLNCIHPADAMLLILLRRGPHVYATRDLQQVWVGAPQE